MIIQSKTYGLTNNFNQLKLKCQNNELLQFYRTMKSCRQRIRRKAHSSGFIDIHDHGWHGGDANHANHEFIKRVASLPSRRRDYSFCQQRQQHFQKTWNIHLK